MIKVWAIKHGLVYWQLFLLLLQEALKEMKEIRDVITPGLHPFLVESVRKSHKNGSHDSVEMMHRRMVMLETLRNRRSGKVSGLRVYYHGREFCPILLSRWEFETVFRSQVMPLYKKGTNNNASCALKYHCNWSIWNSVVTSDRNTVSNCYLLMKMGQNSFHDDKWKFVNHYLYWRSFIRFFFSDYLRSRNQRQPCLPQSDAEEKKKRRCIHRGVPEKTRG